MSPKDDAPFPLRLPRDLYDAIKRYAEGTRTRPRSSMNATIVLLIRLGLEQLEKHNDAAMEP